MLVYGMLCYVGCVMLVCGMICYVGCVMLVCGMLCYVGCAMLVCGMLCYVSCDACYGTLYQLDVMVSIDSLRGRHKLHEYQQLYSKHELRYES